MTTAKHAFGNHDYGGDVATAAAANLSPENASRSILGYDGADLLDDDHNREAVSITDEYYDHSGGLIDSNAAPAENAVRGFWDYDFNEDTRFQTFYNDEVLALADAVDDGISSSPRQSFACCCNCYPIRCNSASRHHILLRHKALWYKNHVDAAVDIHQILRDWSSLHAAARLNR